MTGYELVKKLMKVRRRHILTATEQALYHELINICNEADWEETFHCSNDELCHALHISEKTLVAARNNLVACKLIDYTSGKSRRKYGVYSFSAEPTTVKFTADMGGDTTANASAATSDYNKQNRNTKPNQTSEDKSSDAGQKIFSKCEKEEKEKKSPAAKKEKETTPHWRLLVDEWFHFYRTNAGSGSPPTFEGQAQASLRKICHRLRARAEDGGYEWTAQMARDTFSTFLARAWSIQWLQANFLLPNLERQYDKIVNQYNDENTKQRNWFNDPGSLQSVFAAIDAMPDWT